MSREFATSEIIRQKCSICGSKNKLYTEITFKGIHYGYTLTCCNCGHVDTFMDAMNGPAGLIKSQLQNGKEICIQLTTCTHKECKYYATSKLWDAFTTLESAFNHQNGNDDTINSSSSSMSCCNGSCGSCGCSFINRNSDVEQLDINEMKNTQNPKFH